MKKTLPLLLLLLTTAFAHLWAQTPAISTLTAGNVGSQTSDYGISVAYDVNGEIFYSGTVSGTADLNPTAASTIFNGSGVHDIFISKLNATGSYHWAGKVAGSTSEYVTAVATDAQGNYYITGSFGGTVDFNPSPSGVFNLTSNGGLDIYVAKYNSSGAFQWAKMAGAGTLDQAYDMGVSADGTVYVVGRYQDAVDFDPGAGTFTLPANGGANIFVWKLKPNGNFVSAVQASGTNHEWATCMAFRGSELLLGGQFNGTVDFDPGAGTSNLTTLGGTDAFFLSLDTADLSFNSVLRAGGTGNDEYLGISVDAFDHLFITGYFAATADLDPTAGTNNHTSAGSVDILVTRIRANGTYAWTKTFGGTGLDQGMSLLVHPNGKCYVTGFFEATMDFDPGTGTINETSVGMKDMFVVALDSVGSYQGHNRFGETQADQGTDIALAPDGKMAITGYFGSTVDFGVGSTLTLVTYGISDAFILRVEPYQCPQATVPQASVFQTDLCLGGSTEAFIANGASLGGAAYWQWYTGSCGGTAVGQGDTLPVTPTATETYYVRGEGGCITSPGACASVTVNVTTPPTVTITGDNEVCEGSSTTLTASAPGATNYQWESGPNSQTYTVTPIASQVYTVSVTAGPCMVTQNHTVYVAPMPIPDISYNGVTIAAVQGAATYQWIDCNTNQPIPGETGQGFTPTVVGSYAVIVTLGNCTVTSQCTTAGPTAVLPTTIPGLQLYPNPVQDRLVVDARQVTEIDRIEVHTLVGQLVAAQSLTTAVQTLDMSSLPTGVYAIKVFAGDRVHGTKVIKQ